MFKGLSYIGVPVYVAGPIGVVFGVATLVICEAADEQTAADEAAKKAEADATNPDKELPKSDGSGKGDASSA